VEKYNVVKRLPTGRHAAGKLQKELFVLFS
jgi:hypothetical protein